MNSALTTADLFDRKAGFVAENVGTSCADLTNTVERIDPTTGTVKAFTNLFAPTAAMTATTLLDGTVIAAGGGACNSKTSLPDAIYLPGDPDPGPK